MRLENGNAAVDFAIHDIGGRTIRLTDFTDKYLLLSFYRFASCPFCNLRVHEMSQHYAEFHAQGLEMVAVFQSPADKILKYAGKVRHPFPIIADPDRRLYRAYGVETSWAGVARAMVTRFPDLLRAIFAEGFLPGTIEGEIQRLPADFLIGPDGRVLHAYYGRDIGDHMPLQYIQRYLVDSRAG